MKILGYSERGIINSLIFSIGEDKVLMDGFVKKIGIEELFKPEQPTDYEILLEQSFSGFGDADLVIIVEYESHKKVLFIEGKVKTSTTTKWSLDSQYKEYLEDKNSSNLFFQLYQKSNLFKHKGDIILDSKSSIPSKIRDRKIGDNPIVWKAFKKIEECDEAYYVGLIPSPKDDNNAFNEKLDYKIHFLSWETVCNFCVEKKLNKVLEIFIYNERQIFKSKNCEEKLKKLNINL